MWNTELINLHSNISASDNHSVISPVTTPATPLATLFAHILSTLFAPVAFNEHKNGILGIPGLKIGSYVTTNSTFTI